MGGQPFGYGPGGMPGFGLPGQPAQTDLTELGRFLQSMKPEERAAYDALPGLEDEQGDLKDQMAMAQALRGQPMEHHVSPWGAAFGGLGHMLDVYNSYSQENGLRRKIDALRGVGKKGVGATADAAVRFANQNQSPYSDLLRQLAPTPYK